MIEYTYYILPIAFFFILAFFFMRAIIIIKNRWMISIISFFIGFPIPKYRTIIEKDLKIPMLDSINLYADVYRPNAKGKFPVIVIRTPYDKNGDIHSYKLFGQLFAGQGYVVVIQDVRGKYASEGKFVPYFHEALDGHLTINWAGAASWSNGNVGIVGLSYLGSCAWLTAPFNNQYLKTIIPMFTSQDTRLIWWGLGMPFLKGPLYWLSKYSERTENKNVNAQILESVLWKLPVNMLDEFIFQRPIQFYKEYLKHPHADQFWDLISVNNKMEHINIPALIVGGWYDPFLNGTIEDYRRMMTSNPSKNRYSEMIIGPWSHIPTEVFKEVKYGKHARASFLMRSCLKWCDNWLKQNIPSTENQGKVEYFIMGKNVWREAKQWPPENTVEEKLFLIKEEPETDSTTGLLSYEHSLSPHKHQYVYNPRDPVLFRGGHLLYEDGWIIPSEQGGISLRQDVLVYNSQPMKKELIIAGPVKLVLYVSSTAVDTDFCAKLCDVHRNGKSYNLSCGFIRMRHRESLENPKLMEPNEIYKIEITFKSLAYAFLKNHRLQLQITSSDFPVHNRNLNTGMSCEDSTETKEATQTIYFGGIYESYLILPVLKV